MMNIETLIENTNGMTPNQFESYCDSNGIYIEWLEVTLSNFNDGVYFVTLPDYENANVYAVNGSAIEIEYYF